MRGRALALGLACALCACGGDVARRELVVLAAASLSEAFDELFDDYEGARPGVRVVRSYAGSQTLASQLEAGAAADLVATANRLQMDRLLHAGRVEDPVRFARSRLVWIVRPELEGRPLAPGSAVRSLVLGAPEVPAGAYARAALDRLGLLKRAEAALVSEELDVKGVVQKVLLGGADAGIVYATDVGPALAGRLRVVELGDAAPARPEFLAAVARAAPDPDGARDLLAWLRSPAGSAVLMRHGFEVVR